MTGAIIFSRYSSERLPGKALLDITGRCLLGRVIDRTKEIKGIKKIIVATSKHKSDDQIEAFVQKEGVDIFRGSLNNVAKRALEVCHEHKLDRFVRICGDRPFFSPNLITSILKNKDNLEYDIVTTTFPRTYPPGLTCEIVKSAILTQYINLINNRNDDKEHVTSYFYRNAKEFSIKNIDSMHDISFDGINLCVDNKDDLNRATWIANQINKKALSYDNIPKIIALAQQWHKLPHQK